MRKAFTVFLVALLLLTAGYVAVSIAVNSQREAITWEEETLYGDPSQAAGAKIRTMNHLHSHLLWETEGVLGEALDPATKFTFSNVPIQSASEITYEGLYMHDTVDFLASLSFTDSSRMPGYAKEKYADLIAYCKDCYDSVEIGEEKFFTLDLSDYMDYYSLCGTFDFPGCDWSHWDEFGDYNLRIPHEYIQAINDFFRIPIQGEYLVEFSINLRQYGSSVGTSFAGGRVQDLYHPQFDAVYLNDTCYLTFNTVGPDGEVVDTSLIPGGYGLYRLNTSRDAEGKLVLGDPVAEMVFPMDPEAAFYYLDVSDDGRHIYLHTWEDEKLLRRILDAETMEVLQTIELVDPSDEFYWEMDQYDDFLVIRLLSINDQDPSSNSITVYHEDAQGLYHHSFTVPMNAESLDVNKDLEMYNSVTKNMDFDGETLLVVQNQFESDRYAYSYGDQCNFYVLAYNAEGLSYAGKYHVNIGRIPSGAGSENWLCKPWYDDPITINWN